MKIALCHETVEPRRGGCETYVANLARWLVSHGHTVTLYASRWDAAALPASLRCHQVGSPWLPRAVRPWAFSRACRRQLASAGHDVSVGFDKIAGVDVYYPQGGLYADSLRSSLRKHPMALVRRTLTALRWLDMAHPSFLALEASQLAQPGALVVAISGVVRHQVERHFPRALGQVRSLPIAAATDRLAGADVPARRVAARARWGLECGATVGLFAGMNYRLKGLWPLLEALALVPGLNLLVAGQPDVRRFERLAERLGVAGRVRFVGYCAEMADAYAAADFLVHPTFYDPCANVVLEALACGLPVITSRYNGASELMRGASTERSEGHVINDPHDAEELASCLTRMLDAAHRARCAAAAREAGRAWTFDDHFRGLMGVLEEAAGRAAPRQAA